MPPIPPDELRYVYPQTDPETDPDKIKTPVY